MECSLYGGLVDFTGYMVDFTGNRINWIYCLHGALKVPDTIKRQSTGESVIQSWTVCCFQ